LKDKQLSAEYQRYNDSKTKLKEKLDADKITEEDYTNELSILYQKYLVKKDKLNADAENKIKAINDKELKRAETLEKDKINVEKKMLDIRLNLGKISEEEYSKAITDIRLKLLKQSNEYKLATIKQQKLMEENLIVTEEEKLAKKEFDIAKKKIDNKYKYTTGLEKEYIGEMINLETNYLKNSKQYALMNEEEKQKALADIRKKYLKLIKKEDEEIWTFLDATLQQHIQKMQEIMGMITSLLGNMIQSIQDAADLEIDIVKDKYEREKEIRDEAYQDDMEALEYKYKSGQITEQQYLKQKYADKKKYDKKTIEAEKIQKAKERAIQKQALEEQKKYQKAQVYINSASAIISAWANTIPYPAGAIYAAAQSAVIIAAAAIEIDQINSQHLASGGILQGNLHTQGGIKIGNNEVEGGEYIINRASTERYKPILDSINDAGNGTGNSGAVKELIDYNKLIGGLASVINDKKVILTQRDLVENENSRVNILNKTTF
jgi:hypothetical protein